MLITLTLGVGVQQFVFCHVSPRSPLKHAVKPRCLGQTGRLTGGLRGSATLRSCRVAARFFQGSPHTVWKGSKPVWVGGPSRHVLGCDESCQQDLKMCLDPCHGPSHRTLFM